LRSLWRKSLKQHLLLYSLNWHRKEHIHVAQTVLMLSV
jgi:hypothetical protein